MPFKVKAALLVAVFVVVVVAILLVTGVISPFTEEPVSGELLIWDIAGRDATADFFSTAQAYFPNVRITYVEKNESSYEEELVDALAAGAGPDIFVLPSNALLAHINKINPLPENSGVTDTFVASMPDGAKALLVGSAGEVYGMPWNFDTLALFYNRDHLNSASTPEPPKTWDEFLRDVQTLKRISPLGTVQRAGAALGLIDNVLYSQDIIVALLLQSAIPLYDARGREFVLNDDADSGSPAVSFYAKFADPKSNAYTWNALLPRSIQAFAEEKASYYIGYAADLPRINQLNPHLNFGVTHFPQLEAGERISHARFDFFTVSRTSRSPELAWSVLTLLANSALAKDIADNSGLPPANRSMVQNKPPHPLLKPFYEQILSGKTWPNPRIGTVVSIFRDMVDQILAGSSARSALGDAEVKLNLLLRSL